MKTTQTNEKVQANSTINNVATSYKVFGINGNLCKVIYQGNEYNGKLLNTSPTTHLKFASYDILVPSNITTYNGEEVYTKTTLYNGRDNQTKFKQILNLLQGKAFTFDKSTKPTTTRNNTTKTKVNIIDYINTNEKLKNEYATLKQQYDNAKQQFDNAKAKFDAFIETQTTNATKQQAQNTVEQLLQSGIITLEQIKAMTQGGSK